MFILGFQTPNARVAIHSVAGTFVYGVFAAKMLVIRENKRAEVAGAALSALGAARGGGRLATMLLVLWLTSSLWFFTNVRFGI